MASEKDVAEALAKGKRSGAASARARKKTTKRRKKYYRLQRPDKQAKQAIAKFQHKHPYISAVVGVGGTIAFLDGAGQFLGKGNQALLYEAGITPSSLYSKKGYMVPYRAGRGLSDIIRGLLR